MKKIIYFTFLVLSSIQFTSCGVIFGGAKYNGTIVAKNHPDAEIYVNGTRMGNGISLWPYERNVPLTIELREEGCEAHTQSFDKTFRTGNFILSVLTWGVVGLAVDLASGAAYKPDHLHNPAVHKVDYKNFLYTIDYPGCPVKE